MNKQKVVIVGAGFAGLSIAHALEGSHYDVVIIDKNNYHTFHPLLYQVATGGLEPDSIVYPIRRVFRGNDNIRVRMAEVKKINPDKKVIETAEKNITYDHLVICNGSTNNFFQFDPIQHRLMPLKQITDALDIRSFLMQNLEKAIDPESQKTASVMNVAVVGGGPAGIEMAGSLAEMRKKVLPKDFPEFDFKNMHIYLFEASDRLLGSMSKKSSAATLRYLGEMKVEVFLNTEVKDYNGKQIILKDGEVLEADTLIWTAGVKGNLIPGLPAEAVAGNRIRVDEFNRVIGVEGVYAIGDISSQVSDKYPRGLPMLAPVAMQQGKRLAGNLKRMLVGKPLRPFRFRDHGMMAAIGRRHAVADFPGLSPRLHFKGRMAWMFWMLVHILSLVGFRNKLVTTISWAQSYLFYDYPLGLIIRRFNRKE